MLVSPADSRELYQYLKTLPLVPRDKTLHCPSLADGLSYILYLGGPRPGPRVIVSGATCKFVSDGTSTQTALSPSGTSLLLKLAADLSPK